MYIKRTRHFMGWGGGGTCLFFFHGECMKRPTHLTPQHGVGNPRPPPKKILDFAVYIGHVSIKVTPSLSFTSKSTWLFKYHDNDQNLIIRSVVNPKCGINVIVRHCNMHRFRRRGENRLESISCFHNNSTKINV